MIGRRSHDDAQSFDDALTTGRPPKNEQIAQLVSFAEGLCEAAAVEPSAAFRGSLRAQLMTEAATVLVPMPSSAKPSPLRDATHDTPVRSGRRRVASLSAALVASAGAIGMVASSASAVPGEMLYPVKRGVESVELTLHRDDASRGAFKLSQASERLAEARQLSASGGSTDLIASSLDDFSSAATDGSARLFTAYTDSGSEKPIDQVNDFAATSSLDLRALSEQLPAGLSDSLEAANAALTDLAGEAAALCASCDPADLAALVGPAKAVIKKTPVATKPSPGTTGRAPTSSPTRAPSPSAPVAAAKTPTATTAPPKAVPTLPAKTPSLADITDPLLGGLLGDDDQVGLVPGLVNGLLGTTPK